MTYPDIFFTPEYQNLFKDTEFGGEPCRVSFAGWEYSFYKRAIPGTSYFDIISLYGYSGPIPEDTDDYYGTRWPEFELLFQEYCEKENIVAGFARLHPFLENHKDPQFFDRESITYISEVFYVDLTQPFEFDKGCKSTITKANKTAVRVSDSFTPFEFMNVYYASMTRRQAEPKYFFDLTFFKKLAELPGITLGAYHDGKLVSAINILAHGEFAHYFLSGSTLEQRNLGANNLLLFEAMGWAKYKGCKIFNVGGTFAGDKGLLSFKRSFSKLSKPFFVYKKIYNQEVYDDLCFEKGINPQSAGYFPAYRQH